MPSAGRGPPLRRLASSSRCLFQPAIPSTSRVSNPSLLARTTAAYQSRHISSTTSRQNQIQTSRADRPRWQETPRGMTMPFRIRNKPKNQEWRCNADPRQLDAFYTRLLGQGGETYLSEEVKWLAVTHKSFDQGKRGFNDRLSYLGKRIVDLHISIALISAPAAPVAVPDEFERAPFEHPALDGLFNLSEQTKGEILQKGRMAQLAHSYGLERVLRWKPRKADNLLGSGQEVVLAQTLYAIVGAISLECGGEVAKKVAKEKILEPLGVAF